MKLGVTYIVFDGVELLESSIDQIRAHVDYLQVIYQNSSWFGRSVKPEDISTLKRLVSSGKIDELTLFSNFTPLRDKSPRSINIAKSYEREKRQLGLKSCLKKGCTHYLCMDVDEFYIKEEFRKAKAEIIKNRYARTAVKYVDYVRFPTLCKGYGLNYVPFICEINAVSKMSAGFFVKCDPTRGITSQKKSDLVFPTEKIKMHHMETVRKDLYLKYDSTTRAVFKRDRIRDLVNLVSKVDDKSTSFSFEGIIFPKVGNRQLTVCENIFNIPYENWKR